MVATIERPKAKVQEPTAPGEDGFPVRAIKGVPFSTRPYAEEDRPRYWNPLYPGSQMWWRAEEPNDRGFVPVIQKETWQDGQFRPRNAWEEQMTRDWMVASLEGCNDPDRWKGTNHFDGDDGAWRCQCTWSCGNGHAFQAHLRYLRHMEASSY